MHNGFILQWQWPQFYCIPIQQTAFTLVYTMLKNLILFAIIDACIGVQYFAQRQLHMWTEGTLDQTINLWISRLPTLLIHRLLWRTSWELNQEPQIFNLKTSSDLYQIEDWGGRTSWIILFMNVLVDKQDRNNTEQVVLILCVSNVYRTFIVLNKLHCSNTATQKWGSQTMHLKI